MTHTAIPWEFCGNDKPCTCGYIFGKDGQVYVAKVLNLADEIDPVCNEEMRIENIKFIVQACNTHDELVEALQRMVDYFVGIGLEDDEDGEPNPEIIAARAVLAKCEPKGE